MKSFFKLLVVVVSISSIFVISTCGNSPQTEKIISVKDIEVSGDYNKYLRVVGDDYALKFDKDNKQLSLSIKLELINKPNEYKTMNMGCLEVKLLNNSGDELFVMSFTSKWDDTEKIDNLIRNEDAGKHITITAFALVEDANKLMNEVESFSIMTESFYDELLDELSSDTRSTSDFFQ